MKKITALFSLLLVAVSVTGAGKGDVQKIRLRYARAAGLEKEEQNRHEVHFNSMLPAVGLQKTRVVFVYQSAQADAEKDPYDMVHELFKVVVTWNVAASLSHKCEYLYDARKGLIFFYERREEMDSIKEKRYYFKHRRLFKIVKTDNIEGKSSQDVKIGRAALNAAGKDLSVILKKSRSYARAFTYLLAVEDLK